MGILDSLEWDTEAPKRGGPGRKPGVKKDPVEERRRKLREALEEQREFAASTATGEEFINLRKRAPRKPKKKTNPDGTVTMVMPKERTLGAWWFESHKDGQFRIRVRYANEFLKMGNNTSIKAGPELKHVVGTIDKLIEATKAGEFDDELARVAQEIAERPKGKKNNKAGKSQSTPEAADGVDDEPPEPTPPPRKASNRGKRTS